MFARLYHILRSYLLNGVYAYALFGLYALTISPFMMEFIDYGKKNIAVGLFGLTIYVAEAFAINFKLKMARIRAAIRRKEYFEQTGIDIIPRPNPFVFGSLVLRMALRLIILMVSVTALGIPCTEKKMSSPGIIIIFCGVLADVIAFVYMNLKTGIYRQEVYYRRDWEVQEEENIKWEKENVPLYYTSKYTLLEFVSDFVLQVYAVILFSSIMYYMDKKCYKMISAPKILSEHVDSVFSLVPMLIIITIIWIIPIRVAYWYEDSMMAFRMREQASIFLIFVVVVATTFVPTLVDLHTEFFSNGHPLPLLFTPQYVHYTLAAILLTVLLITRLVNSAPRNPESIYTKK